MANLIACGDCTLYHAIIKPHRNGKGSTDTHKGHCLDQTVRQEQGRESCLSPERKGRRPPLQPSQGSIA